MSSDLDPLLKRLHLANARRMWRDLVQRAEKEQWSYEQLLFTLFAEEVAHRRVSGISFLEGPRIAMIEGRAGGQKSASW